LKNFWYTRGYFGEGRDWLEKLLAYAREPTPLQANALDQAGFLARYQADYDAARRFIGESLVIWRLLGDDKGLADSLANLGFVSLYLGDLQGAQDLYDESLAINRRLGNQQGIADALSHLGMIAFYLERLDQAKEYHLESLAIWRKLGDMTGVSHALNRLATVAFQSKRYDEAYGLTLESLKIARDLNFIEGIAWTLEILAACAAVNAQPGQAIFLEAAYTSYRQSKGLPASPSQSRLLEGWLGPAYQSLTPAEIEKHRAAGCKMPVEQIVAKILSAQPFFTS
jgi:tetratricopeptide (TPR) repeat protein